MRIAANLLHASFRLHNTPCGGEFDLSRFTYETLRLCQYCMRGRDLPIKVHASGSSTLRFGSYSADLTLPALSIPCKRESSIKRFTHFILQLCHLDFPLPCILHIWFFGFATRLLEYAAVLILVAFGISFRRERQPIRLFHHHWSSFFAFDTSRRGECHASDTSTLLLGLWNISGSQSSCLQYSMRGRV